jgi:hypothetical protein
LPHTSYSQDDLQPHNEDSPAFGGDFQQAAWERYLHEHDLKDADRGHFRINAENGPPQTYLDVWGVSPADAFETFKRINGILTTVAVPVVEPAPDPEPAAAPTA